MSFSDLSSDLIHEIFVRIGDVATLYAAICTSKAYYEVFKAHPKSILRAVLHNTVGPAFPAAARLAHYLDAPDSSVVQLPSEDHFADLDWIIPGRLVRRLEQRATAVQTLEDFYSQRWFTSRHTNIECTHQNFTDIKTAHHLLPDLNHTRR